MHHLFIDHVLITESDLFALWQVILKFPMYVLFNVDIFVFPPTSGYIIQQKSILKYTLC